MDWEELRSALRGLEKEPLRIAEPEPFDGLFSRLESLTPALRGYPMFDELRASPERRAALEEAARRLARWEEEAQRRVLGEGRGLSTQLLERWNSLFVRARDLAWMMEQDVLGSLQRLQRLLPTPLHGDPRARFQAWKLGGVLENIGRLEVRGRDSLGVSCLVSFDGPESYRSFRESLGPRGLEAEWERRRALPDLVHAALRDHPSGPEPCLVFVFKVAEEVGALGDNVRRLEEAVRQDTLFWTACASPGARTNLFAHTRWASNGIISEANCHPVDSETLGGSGEALAGGPGKGVEPGPGSSHRILAALNGDVDNYQELVARLAAETGRTLSPRITTDAKIIPVLVDHFYRRTGDLRAAFCQAMREFEGSLAVVMHSTGDPHRTYLALRGSGQSMFVGLSPGSFPFASELYGIVDQTSRFLRMDGRSGQVLVLDARRAGELSGIEAWSLEGKRLPLDESCLQTAEITTRDINRGPYEHFLLKEITESPLSVEKTLRGKFFLPAGDEAAPVTVNLGPEVFPEELVKRLREGKIRRILLIGQGTAAVAGSAVASMMKSTLAAAPVEVRAMKATELSGYCLGEDMSDALVLAISQSGTTTDTNRTVDLVRERGAVVIGIVNRRNSDLVYRVDGVLYTSDGRDIEMSVASTKAFYSQVVAGYLIAYRTALLMGTMTPVQVRRELEDLERLPDKMRVILKEQGRIRELAERWAPTRRDWAVVGSGPTRPAAEEIRIKLSELCYKSIAIDDIEDKKHIDLSSEPLTLVCTAGLSVMALKDVVKEVAIFKSHKSVPIVICSEGFDAFEPYAAGIIHVPMASANASVLLNTMVGHLWGYYCARAIDRGTARLRPARGLAVRQLLGEERPPLTSSVIRQIMSIGRGFQEDLGRGRFNSSLSTDTAARLSLLFNYFTGAQSLRQFAEEFRKKGTLADLAESLVATLSQAIQEVTRPIDAIKHQAKTITVGISRLEEDLEGVLREALEALGLPIREIPYRDLILLRAITPAVEEVAGATLYQVNGLGTLGEPLPESTVRVVHKTGVAAGIPSRADRPHPLMGTKEWVVRNRCAFVGLGRNDERPIVIVPHLPMGQVERLALLHLRFWGTLPLERKVSCLRDMGTRYEDLRTQVEETDLRWDDRLLETVSPRDLVTLPAAELAERLISQARVSAS